MNPRSGLLTWLWLAPFLLAFAPTFVWLFERWTRSIYSSGHLGLMPFVIAYLVHDQLRADPIQGERSSALGFVFVGAGLTLLVVDASIHTQLLAAVGFVLCLPGLSLLLLGVERTRALIFPLLIAPMMLPIPAAAAQPLYLLLRRIAAWGTSLALSALGIPVARDDTLLHLPTTIVHVADACSGFNILYGSIVTALILAHLIGSRGRRWLLLGLALPLAMLTNTIRVIALSLIIHYRGPEMLETALHETTGVVAFAAALVLLFLVAGKEIRSGGRVWA